MAPLYLIFSLLILDGITCFSQPGALVIIVSTGEEITVAADSRRSFFETTDYTKEPLAYIDSARKLFKLNKYILVADGPPTLGQEYFHKVIDNFNKISAHEEGVYKTLKRFVAYLDRKYPVNLFPERKELCLLAAGFFNGISEIAEVSALVDTKLEKGELISNEKAYKYAAADIGKFNSLFDEIENTMNDYADGEHKKNQVGGPVSIVQINDQNEIIWIKNNFSNENYSISPDFYAAVKEGKVKINCVASDCRKKLIKILKN